MDTDQTTMPIAIFGLNTIVLPVEVERAKRSTIESTTRNDACVHLLSSCTTHTTLVAAMDMTRFEDHHNHDSSLIRNQSFLGWFLS